MDFDRDDFPDPTGQVFREFGLACRVERDRLAVARLADEDRRFDTSSAERKIAELFVARLIADVASR